jgi:D-alanyl-lipoteichoic acid acyltransferase DltB (MBOAT superfamily)
MVFNSLTFVVFFLVVLGLHNLPLPWRVRKINLLLASYLFYAAWNPFFVILLWTSTFVDWFVAKWMAEARTLTRRKTILILSLTVNLGLLGYFKYGTFLLTNLSTLLQQVGITYQPAGAEIFLPIGISFYTFETLSYTLDVYRKQTPPWKSFLDFALFVAFFPHLVAGPIVRAVDFLPQCLTPRRATARQLGWGFTLLLIGLFEKVILADQLLAPAADQVYTAGEKAGGVDAWIGTLAFSGQIFFDFAGYSTCAIGAALCLGFVLKDNFRFPYAALGFSDFWRRWHISLSTWLRDYLYISLGGNRRGAARTHVNLLLTMLLGGLWHGASWRFVIWGGLHGVYLVVERLLGAVWKRSRLLEHVAARVLLVLLTYLCVSVAWVFFRAQDFHVAFIILRAMVTGGARAQVLEGETMSMVIAITFLLLLGQWLLRESSIEELAGRLPWWLRSLVLTGLLLSLALASGDERAFIYFQF